MGCTYRPRRSDLGHQVGAGAELEPASAEGPDLVLPLDARTVVALTPTRSATALLFQWGEASVALITFLTVCS
jgi:hypothetical protein